MFDLLNILLQSFQKGFKKWHVAFPSSHPLNLTTLDDALFHDVVGVVE